MDPLLFGAGVGSFAAVDSTLFGTSHYLAFIFPGILGLGFLGAFYPVVYRVTMDGHYGLQGLKIGAGVGILSYILGNLTLPSLMALIQALVSMGVCMMLATPMGSISNIILMLGVGLVSTWFWGGLAILASFSFLNYTQRDLFMNVVMLPVTLASPTFYPLENAPRYLQLISSLNPFTYHIIALREAFLYGKVGSAWMVMLLLTILLLVCSMRLMAKREWLSTNI